HEAGFCSPETGLCSNPSLTDGAPCDDGNACTVLESCIAGVCVGGAALDCDDDNVCTTDACDRILGCHHTDLAASCDDGDVCTPGDSCDSGRCVPGSTVDCDDGDDCTDDGCDREKGCFNLENQASCDDGNRCTVDDLCDSGSCTAGRYLVEQCCGDPDANGIVSSADALFILKRAVGLSVQCPLALCDVDLSGDITAVDALLTLKASVGLAVELVCHDAEGSGASSTTVTTTTTSTTSTTVAP
ncbi:MAG: hypothetical protein ACE5E4_13180, partial [Candidatus Binatia bacterium]